MVWTLISMSGAQSQDPGAWGSGEDWASAGITGTLSPRSGHWLQVLLLPGAWKAGECVPLGKRLWPRWVPCYHLGCITRSRFTPAKGHL